MLYNKEIKRLFEIYGEYVISSAKKIEISEEKQAEIDQRMLKLIRSLGDDVTQEEKTAQSKKEKPKNKVIPIARILTAAALIGTLIIMSTITVSGSIRENAGMDVKSFSFGTRITNESSDDKELIGNDNAPTTLKDIYKPKLDDAYTLVYEDKNEFYAEYVYTDKNGDELRFMQKTLDVGEYFEDSDFTCEEFEYAELDYLFYSYHGKNILCFNEYDYSFTLSSRKLSKDELLDISLTLSRDIGGDK